MLKTRIVGVVLVRQGIAVQSIGFSRYLPIGRPEIAIEYLDRWGVDEIVVLHMDAAVNGMSPSASVVASYSKCCQVPLAIGGGITDAASVRRIIQAGADKIVVNSAAFLHPDVITRAADMFGVQCVVVSIDARRTGNGGHEAFVQSGTRPAGISARQMAADAVNLGAGEILINSIDRDGSKQGYDLELVSTVAASVNVPVIACGGAGHPGHMLDAMHAGASAVAAANFLHYTEHSVTLIKRYLVGKSACVRLDSYANYDHHRLDADGRLAKQDDAALDALRFRYVAEEVI